MREGWRRRTGKEVRRLLDAANWSRKLARRPSFGTELLAAGGVADGLQTSLMTLREEKRGPASASEAS